jgi:glycogen debranching enzyme
MTDMQSTVITGDFAGLQATEQPFYIPATSGASRPRRSLKHNDTFAVFDSHGDIGATAGGPDGLFDFDTRFLSHLELLINGTQPLLLGSTVRDDNLHLYVDLTNPDIFFENAIVLPKDTVHISRILYLRKGVLRERISVQNHGNTNIAINLSVAFDADFADIFEVRGIRRAHRGKSAKRVVGTNDVIMTYDGLDGLKRETSLCFEPTPDRLSPSIATYTLTLKPGGRSSIFIAASCRGLAKSTMPFFTGLRGAYRERKDVTDKVASIETSNSTLNETLCRSMSDFYMLVSETEQGSYPSAGIPWYSTTFGRDGLIAAMQMLWLDPSIAKGVLRRLAHFQATEVDPASDAQPGKILHEMRGGEMSALHEVPFGLYYGSVDATPLFVMLVGLYVERTGDTALAAELWPAVERAIGWMNGAGDCDGDGFVEYSRAKETGLSNQGWKDSHDAIFHADGRMAEGPIALVEVQAYVYAAKCQAANCAMLLGKAERAAELLAEAEALRQKFERAFWSDKLGSYVIALDGRKRQCVVRSSNAGHALFAGIASPDRAWQLAKQLLSSDFYSGWGIRTIARGESRYNPMSYHNGSIWPHDNALIAGGFANYGLKAEIVPVFDALARAATYMDQRRLPELYCGFQRKRGRGPTLYPVACAPQAWASGAPFMVLQAALGVEFDTSLCEVRLMNPVVPVGVGEIIVRGLQLCGDSVDFSVRRDGQAVSLRVLRRTGSLRVTLASQKPTMSKGAGRL